MPLPVHELAAFASSLADASRPIILGYFHGGVAVEHKSGDQPVTRADREAEAAIRALIEERFPDHGIAGEEYGKVRTDAEYVWSLDPVDGTKAFITGSPRFGTLIGLCHRGQPILGVLDMPALDQRWIGGAGHMARLNGSPCRTRACASLAEAYLVTTSPLMYRAPADGAAFERVRSAVLHTVYGGDCHNAGTLASGKVDLFIESNLQDYDYLAWVPIIEAAGGIVTDWAGNRPGLDSTDRVIAAGDKRMHAAALALLNGS
jgi:inositol-phosphate phosphatase / L-galactose 1-phosphate phosphatase / histidinol-phosphatase